MPMQVDIFEDKHIPGTWRVEFIDRFGVPCNTIFVGPNAWARAAAYREELIGDSWSARIKALAS